MAIAHVCLGCGFDLARVRPRVEPHYRLPLVTCPECGAHTVRRVHPLWTKWKNIRRADWALTVVVLKSAVIAGLVALNLAGIGWLMAAGYHVWTGTAGEDIGWFIVGPLLFISPLIGICLTAMFSHIKLWRVWMGWFVLMLIPLLFVTTVSLIIGEFPTPGGDIDVTGADLRGFVVVGLLFLVPAELALVAMCITALLGIPLGLGFRALEQSRRQWLYRWRLKRRRSWRTASS